MNGAADGKVVLWRCRRRVEDIAGGVPVVWCCLLSLMMMCVGRTVLAQTPVRTTQSFALQAETIHKTFH